MQLGCYHVIRKAQLKQSPYAFLEVKTCFFLLQGLNKQYFSQKMHQDLF